MSEQATQPLNFKHTEIFLGCYFTDYLIEHYQEYLDGNLANLAEEIDSHRVNNNEGTINRKLFLQLRSIFHTIVSVSSARIEGNNTSIKEYIRSKWDNPNIIVPAHIKEIQNLERAISFVESRMYNYPIDKEFICKLHEIIVDGLQPEPHGKGDKQPGTFRKSNPIFANHHHLPPHWEQVEEYMQKLIEFIGTESNPQYDLLKATVAQHRLVWIHPFNNANGRLSRLLTYAIIVKASLDDKTVRRRNPALVLCKNDYYNHLALADKNTDKGIKAWIEYIFNGLNDEVIKLNKLTDYNFLREYVLHPAINRSLDKNLISEKDAQVLRKAIEKQVIQAVDVKEIYPNKADAEISREIKRLIDKNLLIQENIGTRKYVIRVDKSFLLSEMIQLIEEIGYLSSVEDTLE